MKLRSFLGLVPFRRRPVFYGDGIRDDSAGIKAMLAGTPWVDRSGGKVSVLKDGETTTLIFKPGTYYVSDFHDIAGIRVTDLRARAA